MKPENSLIERSWRKSGRKVGEKWEPEGKITDRNLYPYFG